MAVFTAADVMDAAKRKPLLDPINQDSLYTNRMIDSNVMFQSGRLLGFAATASDLYRMRGWNQAKTHVRGKRPVGQANQAVVTPESPDVQTMQNLRIIRTYKEGFLNVADDILSTGMDPNVEIVRYFGDWLRKEIEDYGFAYIKGVLQQNKTQSTNTNDMLVSRLSQTNKGFNQATFRAMLLTMKDKQFNVRGSIFGSPETVNAALGEALTVNSENRPVDLAPGAISRYLGHDLYDMNEVGAYFKGTNAVTGAVVRSSGDTATANTENVIWAGPGLIHFTFLPAGRDLGLGVTTFRNEEEDNDVGDTRIKLVTKFAMHIPGTTVSATALSNTANQVGGPAVFDAAVTTGRYDQATSQVIVWDRQNIYLAGGIIDNS